MDSIVGVLAALTIGALWLVACQDQEGIIPLWVAGLCNGAIVVLYGMFVKAWTVKMMVRGI